MEETVKTIDRFQGNLDRFKGITVKSEEESCSLEQLESRLKTSISSWKEDGVRAVWFHVKHQDASWVPVLVNNGFSFHHANPERLALLKWIDETDTCNVPSYAHTLVGVGGMVVTNDNRVLVVQERFRFSSHWKLPGGYVDPGEDIDKAAVREVFEETGIQTKFRSIVAFRHGHNFNFNCSDIYIVVALTPISEEIKFDEKEISKCQWMPIEEYATSPLVHDTNRYFAEKFMECNKTGTFIGIKEIQLKLANFTLDQKIYGIDNNKQ